MYGNQKYVNQKTPERKAGRCCEKVSSKIAAKAGPGVGCAAPNCRSKERKAGHCNIVGREDFTE